MFYVNGPLDAIHTKHVFAFKNVKKKKFNFITQ